MNPLGIIKKKKTEEKKKLEKEGSLPPELFPGGSGGASSLGASRAWVCTAELWQ